MLEQAKCMYLHIFMITISSILFEHFNISHHLLLCCECVCVCPGVQCNAGTVHVLWRGFSAGLFHYRQEKVQCVGVAVWLCVGVDVNGCISAQTVTIHTHWELALCSPYLHFNPLICLFLFLQF